MSILGLDVGTTGCKAIAFSDQGEVLSHAYREYAEQYPKPGWAELDPYEVWAKVKDAISEAAAKARSPVKALSISTLGEAITPIDKNGEALCSTITSVDSRARKQVEELAERVGPLRIFEITGQPLHSSYSLPKIMWLRDERPDILKKTWKILLCQDLMYYRLGLQPAIDHSLAGRSLALDIRERRWSDEMLTAARLDSGILSEPRPSGEVIGEIPLSVARQLGLERGVKVVTGGHDQPCCALGAGVIEPGVGTDTTGTVECMTISLSNPILTADMLARNHPIYPHVAPGRYVVLAFVYTAGNILRWYRDNFAAEERQRAAETGRDVYDLLVGTAAEGPTDVFLLPHFTGSGTPYLDADSRGAIIGLTLGTRPAHIIRAILDGVAFEMRVNLQSVKDGGIPVDRLRAIGGGAKSDRWLQAKADIVGIPIDALDVSEAGCLGVAILAGTATGAFKSIEEACRALVRPRKTFYPDPAKKHAYDEAFALYKGIYEQLKELNRSISRFAAKLSADK